MGFQFLVTGRRCCASIFTGTPKSYGRMGDLARQLVVAGLLASGVIGHVHAADVSLTAAVNAPTAATLVPFTYTVTFGNATTPATTAMDAQIALALPADLYDIGIVSAVGTGGASCPAVGAFAGVPAAGTLTTGSEVITAAIAGLPTNGACTVTVSATAMRPRTYPLQAVIQPGPGDALSGSANDTFGNTVVTPSTLHLAVDKSVLGPVPMAAVGPAGAQPYGAAVTYQIVWRNNAPIDIPLDLVGTSFFDREIALTDARPGALTPTNIQCVATGGTLCPSVVAVAGAPFDASGMAYAVEITNPAGSWVFKANSTITVTYDRVYTPPVCGASSIVNQAGWGTGPNYADIVWDSAGGGDTGAVEFALTPDAAPCTPRPIAPAVTKVLDRITDGAGALKTATAPFRITADGDTAHYTITLQGDPGYGPVKFRFRDLYASTDGGQPTFMPAGSVLQTATLDSCTISGAGTGACPQGVPSYPHALPGESATADFVLYPLDTVVLDAGQSMVIKLSLRYTIGGALCNAVAGQMVNTAWFTALEAPPGFVYTGSTEVTANTAATPLAILPALSRCVDITANKQVSTVSPSAGAPFTFTLDYTNSTSSTTGNAINPPNPLTNVAVTDTLGAAFTPSAVSCSVVSGTATAPSVSLAQITGADHTFSTLIPSIEDAAIVRCTITGSTSLPGTYTNLTRAAVTTPGLVDAKPSNDTSQVNYGVVGTQVSLTKTVSPTGQVARGSTLVYTVTATASGSAAGGTVVRDTPPAEIQSFSWTCSATGGAVCPVASRGADGTGGTALNETIATFPAGSSVAYTITAIVDATAPATAVTNTASTILPPNSSCLPGFTASPCTAQASNTLPPAPPAPPASSPGTGGAAGITPVPVDAPWMLSVLALGLGGLAARRLRQRT